MFETVQQEACVESLARLQEICESINFRNSIFEKLNISYEISGVGFNVEDGFRIRLCFERPDILTGKIGKGIGRYEYVPYGSTYSFAVKTIWVLFELLIRHEMMEAFQVGNYRPFNPHTPVEDLVWLQTNRVNT